MRSIGRKVVAMHFQLIFPPSHLHLPLVPFGAVNYKYLITLNLFLTAKLLANKTKIIVDKKLE